MSTTNKQIARFETTAVYTHPDAKVDIILVHGLNGEPEKTWTAKNKVFWPTDLLPESLRGTRANILVYGYNADVYSKKHGTSPSDNFIYLHAQTLVTSLTHYRKDEMASRNPIIWVCHSLGGILVKRALLYSNDLRSTTHEDYRQIFVSTYGIIFLGTPHTGSDAASWGTMLQAMSDAVIPKAFWHTEPVLLRSLKRDNETLQNINSHFLDIQQRFKILMARENQMTDLKGTKMLVVDAQSACPLLPAAEYCGIEATHSGMCKFSSKDAPGYRTVSASIREWVDKAVDVISTRWRIEEEERLAIAKHEIEERMKPWIQDQQAKHISQAQVEEHNSQHHSSDSRSIVKTDTGLSKPMLPEPSTPDGEVEFLSSQMSTTEDQPRSHEPFFVPMTFKPNTHFKGREIEMRDLHRILSDPDRRSTGTSPVLIQSMPGGGKSHLARQYVFQHKHQYPGGVFWIQSKSQQELECGYWDIARTVRLKEVEHLHQDGLNDTRKMVMAVRMWLSRASDWLLVLDGVHFDLPDLPDFIPFTKNTSIIYTSTERTPGEDYDFGNPEVIALDRLSAQDAQELLLEEMGKKQPWSHDDLSRATELVELMDRLPLSIHVVALQLKATHEPLSTYLRTYRKKPRASNLLAYRAVRDELSCRGNHAALNLMSLLSFFGQHVPVEMLALGLKVLDKRTPVKTRDVERRKASLNNTFKVLIAFALIERNENTGSSSASGRSSRSVDMDQDNLDILRIRNIVQNFFIDTLADEKQASFWLERAIKVFCRAFDESLHRIREDPMTGKPEDYLRFQIHGNKLLSSLERFERKAPELRDAHSQLQSRLDSIQAQIDQLGKHPVTGDPSFASYTTVSVFERANSLSELDSESPPSSEDRAEMHLQGGEMLPTDSPVGLSPTEYNPYHWHISYNPHHVNASEGMASGDGSKTVTPQLTATEIFESMTIPDYEPHKPTEHRHRTVRRHEARRRRDHAGAWRASSQALSDPRVSLSRETARGFISAPNAPNAPIVSSQRGGRSSSSSNHRLTASSEAELTLNKITKTAPPPPRGGAFISDKSRALSASGGNRPKLIAGRPSYTTTPQTDAVIEDDYPVTPIFSTFDAARPTSSSIYAAATIIRLKENERLTGARANNSASPKLSSPLTAAPLTATPTQKTPPASRIPLRRDSSIGEPASGLRSGQPPRTTRSSTSVPAYAGPFRPPTLQVEINSSSSLRSPTVADGSGWDVSEPFNENGDTPYDEFRKPSRQNTLSRSLPSTRYFGPHDPPYPDISVPLPPEPFAVAIHSPPWISPETKSEPMTRNPSHQSSHSHGSSLSAPYARGNPLVLGSGAPSISSSPSFAQVMQRPQPRRPSVIETEPSPRLTGFEMENTSYQLSGRHRAGSGGAYYRGAAAASSDTQIPSSTKPGYLDQNGPSSSSLRHRRTESAGGRLLGNGYPVVYDNDGKKNLSEPRLMMPMQAHMTNQSRGSPDLIGVGGAFGPPLTSISGRPSNGEQMARSGSGGIKLANGTFIGFGEIGNTSPGSLSASASAGHARIGSTGSNGAAKSSGQRHGRSRSGSSGFGGRGVGLGIME